MVHEASRCLRSVMKNTACQLEHSVEAEVSRRSPGTGGPKSTTGTIRLLNFSSMAHSPMARGDDPTSGQEPLRWQIRDVRPDRVSSSTPLAGAVISFEWLFDAVSEQRTRITQRFVLAGDNAPADVNQVQAGFGSNLRDSMKTIADAMVRAARSTER